MYRRIGRVMRPIKPHAIATGDLEGTLTIGDVVATAADDKPFTVTCATSENGAPATLHEFILRERFDSASAVKLKMRWFILNAEVTVVKGDPFYIDDAYYAGHFDILDTDYIDLPDNATATDGAAVAIVKNLNLQIYPGSYSNTFYLVPVALEDDATGYAAGAEWDINAFIEEH
jgi:hypothetical protein